MIIVQQTQLRRFRIVERDPARRGGFLRDAHTLHPARSEFGARITGFCISSAAIRA
ncbi:MAG: hypothetical protein HC855_13350 [Rhizobiales bacterium]|nr:hypothetical protein [Hyphomicrobiales bacterium]